MLLAKILCSDRDCLEEIEIAVETLAQLDGLVCDCGFGFVLLSVSERPDTGGELLALPARRSRPVRRAA